MALTKVEKAANAILKNPEITNVALADLVKTNRAGAWSLRQSAEKFIDRKGLRPKAKPQLEHKVMDKAPPAPSAKVPSLTSDIDALGGRIEIQGEYVNIRIPTKAIGSILFSKLMH